MHCMINYFILRELRIEMSALKSLNGKNFEMTLCILELRPNPFITN